MKYFALLAAVAITTTACAGPNGPASMGKSNDTSTTTASANQKAPVKYRFKEIEVDGNYCVVHIFGGQYSNGQPYRHAFVPSAEVCEKVTEPGFRAGVAASATQGVTTYDSEKK